ncbi:hypothetical protein CGCS363_v009846 [Colletotrichum siamense]|uniref:uncharacterized protein n=1 Tax=Colletotrichum siamense TaxID=690259 RepID=UPI0018722C10|nr:uncharacterized protein CGCS363_v009846 [Colletotrichum siamense]KAF5495341.1 hypothetical protein CGCS363_v009846 [Colletotrichum siamense]
MSLPHKNDFGDSKSIHHWLLANEGSTTGKGLALDQVPDSDGPSRIHDWLEKDTSGPEAKSLVSRLCEECVKGAKAALRSIQTQNAIPTVAYRSLERSGSSFILWVDGHRVTEGQLDHTLEKSRMLRKSLLKLLISIGSTLSDVPPSVTHPRTQILEHLTSEAREAYQSTSGSSDSEDSDFDVSSVSGPTDWGEIADNMRTDVECLMDLESLIESPFIDNRKANSFNESTKYMNLDTRCQFYSDKIGHRFPEAEPDLVDRLATASWDRFLRIRVEKNNIVTEENHAMASTALVVANKSEKGSSFYDSGLGTSLATTSAYAETVMSYRQNNDCSIKIPLMPEEGKRGDPFECVACGRRVTMASNSGWKYETFVQ